MRFIRRLANSAAAVLLGVVGTILSTTDAVAEGPVTVDSEITAHELPYLNSPYVVGSTLHRNQTVRVECRTRGREFIGGSVEWYRINAVYYPEYAFNDRLIPGIPECGIGRKVRFAASGYSHPTFNSPAAEHWFSSGEDIMVLCTAAGQNINDSDAWFFTKGYWLHNTRIYGWPDGSGFSTCPGYSKPGQG